MDTTTRWEQQVECIRIGFEYELCDECGQDLNAHLIGPDPLGNAHAYCETESRSGWLSCSRSTTYKSSVVRRLRTFPSLAAAVWLAWQLAWSVTSVAQ